MGNSTTTPKDLVCDEDVKIVLYILAESVAARLRENGFRCRVVEISVRDNELFSFTRQKKIDHATNITGEIAAYAYQIFKENYNWSKPIRSVGVRGADLVTDNYWEQIDLMRFAEDLDFTAYREGLCTGTGFCRQSMQKKNTQYIHMGTFQVSNEKCQ